MRKCHKASIAYRVPAPGVVREASEGARRGRAAPSTAPTTLDADGTGERVPHGAALAISTRACLRNGKDWSASYDSIGDSSPFAQSV
jgi:hypothetical protein